MSTSLAATSRPLHSWRAALSNSALFDASSRDTVAPWGWPAAIGVLCLAIAAMLVGVWIPAQRAELASLEKRSFRLVQQQAALLSARASAAQAVDAPSRSLDAVLPPHSAQQQRIAAMLTLASSAGLASRRADFKLAGEPNAAPLEFNVSLSVSGPYLSVRRFVEAALRADPGVSLDRVQLRRISADSGAVDAELLWTLHSRRPLVAQISGSAKP